MAVGIWILETIYDTYFGIGLHTSINQKRQTPVKIYTYRLAITHFNLYFSCHIQNTNITVISIINIIKYSDDDHLGPWSTYLWRRSSASSHQPSQHYNDVILGAMVSQIIRLTIVYLTVYSGADQRKHQSSASLDFVRGIHRWPVIMEFPEKRALFPTISWFLLARIIILWTGRDLIFYRN